MVKLYYNNYVLNLKDTIYEPSDDTYLLLDTLKKEDLKNINEALEIGVGNGLISLYLYDFVNKMNCVDINSKVITYLEEVKQNYDLKKLNIIKSNLFENISKNKKFDLIVFNPPYVCSEFVDYSKIEDIDLCTNGGKNGSQIINLFLEQLRNHLLDKGVCYLLISSQNKPRNIYKRLMNLNYKYNIINTSKLFFEELFIIKITL